MLSIKIFSLTNIEKLPAKPQNSFNNIHHNTTAHGLGYIIITKTYPIGPIK